MAVQIPGLDGWWSRDEPRCIWVRVDGHLRGKCISDEELQLDRTRNGDNQMTNRSEKMREIREGMAFLAAEAKRLESLPKEPIQDNEGNSVILFKKSFNDGGTEYTYAAVRIPSTGKWYISGNRSGVQNVTWDYLVEWITDGATWEIWECDSYNWVAGSD